MCVLISNYWDTYRSFRCTDPLRPDDGEERLRRCSGNHDEDVLRYWIFYSYEEDVAYDLRYLYSKTGYL